MRNVDGHTDAVHTLDDRSAEIRDTFVLALCRAIANKLREL
jgi:hypothetical protein